MKAPIKDFVCKAYPQGNITQWFGESPTLYARFGMKGHNGIDIVAPWGTPLYAVEGGLVCEVKNTPEGYGKHIRILSNGNEWTYGHLAEIGVAVGDTVEEGQYIGLMGNTGFVVSGSTPFWKHNPYAGTHLHLGVRKYRKSKNGFKYNPTAPGIVVSNYENGYHGSVDFRDMLESAEVEKETITSLYLTVISLYKMLINVLNKKVI